ncbi:MAG: pilus assembly protein [Caldilineaceae bacterium]|nr:pilus assembly protein [Caldilineaceae bacterium]MBP8107365.1 pilus assembly protein [Caldilineaceae bacterium]MBP8124284.1 pilus assembly protein [Caldilineaceae bacterium]MBP9074268.1 pilus assembly protein [Caldilineaceae bacterium]
MGSHIKTQQTQSQKRHDQEGQSLVELALALPILLLFISILFDGGRAAQGYISIMNASREAAMAGAQSALSDTQLTAIARAEVARNGLDGGLLTVTITYAGSSPSQTITVAVRYVMPVITSVSPVSDYTLTTSAQMLVFR